MSNGGNHNGVYRTSDTYLAAWLLSKQFALTATQRWDKRRVDFIFEDRPERPELVNGFLCGRAEGNLADFIYHLRRAKRLLYVDS